MAILLTILGGLIRFWRLGARPFDGDEGVIFHQIEPDNLNEITRRIANDIHPPLFHFLTKISTLIFGGNEWGLRFISALFGALAVYLSYLVAKKLFSENVAKLSTFLFALSPLAVYYSQEARPYAFFTFLVLLNFYLFLLLLEDSRGQLWFWYLVSNLLLVYTIHTSWIILVGEGLVFLFSPSTSLRARQFLNWLGTFALTILGFSFWWKPFYFQILGRAADGSGATFKSSLVGLATGFYRFGIGRLFLDFEPKISYLGDLFRTGLGEAIPVNFFIFFLTLVPLILFFIGIIVVLRDHLPALAKLFPFLFLLVLSFFASDMAMKASRSLSFLIPFYLMFVSLGVLAIRGARPRIAVLVILIFLSLLGLYDHFTREINAPSAKTIAQYIAKNSGDGDALLVKGAFGGGEELVFKYYYPKPLPLPEIKDFYADYKIGNLKTLQAQDPIETLKSLKDGKTIWFYDMAYSGDVERAQKDLGGKIYDLGLDKEKKPLKLLKIE